MSLGGEGPQLSWQTALDRRRTVLRCVRCGLLPADVWLLPQRFSSCLWPAVHITIGDAGNSEGLSGVNKATYGPGEILLCSAELGCQPLISLNCTASPGMMNSNAYVTPPNSVFV